MPGWECVQIYIGENLANLARLTRRQPSCVSCLCGPHSQGSGSSELGLPPVSFGGICVCGGGGLPGFLTHARTHTLKVIRTCSGFSISTVLSVKLHFL